MKHMLPIFVAALAVTGCAEKQPMTVSQFLENDAALHGTLARCQDNPSAGTDAECRNARSAAERISVIEERAMRKAREEAFTTAREEYRTQLDRERALRLKAEAEAEEARLQSLLAPPEEDDVAAPAEPENGTEPEPPTGD